MSDTISKAIRFVLLGDDKSATNALKNTGKAFTKTGGQASGMGGKIRAAGAVVGTALVAAGAAAVKFGNDSIAKYKKVAGETLALKRITGMTAEDASRLGFSFKQSGVDVGAGTKALQIFSKNVAAAASGSKTQAAALDGLGIKYKDAAGKVKPMADLMPQLADRFSTMADGPEKSALAMKLFGKSGTAMLPFLNKGAAGLGELAKKSDEFGNTLSDKQLQALKDSKQAQRDWDAAMDGLQTTLGAYLLPLLTQGAQFLNTYMVPAFEGITHSIDSNQDAFTALGNIFRWVWNKILLPVVKAFIWAGAEITKVYGSALVAIGKATGNHDLEVLGETMTRNAQAAEDWGNSLQEIPDQVKPKISVNDDVTKPVKDIDKKIQSIKDKIVKAKAKGDTKAVDDLQTKLDQLKDKKITITAEVEAAHNPKVILKVGGKTGTIKIGVLARGGRAIARQPYLVGEKGPELWMPDTAGYMLNAARTAALARASLPVGGRSAVATVMNTFNINVSATPGTDRVALGIEIRELLRAAQAAHGRELNIG